MHFNEHLNEMAIDDYQPQEHVNMTCTHCITPDKPPRRRHSTIVPSNNTDQSHLVDAQSAESRPWYQEPKSSIGRIQWGSNHCVGGVQDKKRIAWTLAEIKYIVKWLERHGNEGSIRQLLKTIINDPSAHPIFHFNHIIDSSRLAHGVKTARNCLSPDYIPGHSNDFDASSSPKNRKITH